MSKAKSQSPPPSARADGKIHLHVENTGELGPVFEASPERVAAALKDHPDVAERLHVTIGYDGDIIERELPDADILFAWNFDRGNLVARAPRLKWVHAHGAGVNHLMPLTWLPKGAVLTNSRGVHAERASEYAIMAVLMLNNRLPEMVTNQRHGRWEQLFNSAVVGKTLLIVGVGHVGGSVASWAKRFGMRVIGIRRTGRNHRSVDAMHPPADLPKLLPEADFVLIAAPHTDATHHLIGADEIALLKRGAGLVNYSRANLVDYEALRGRLERGEISAVLDVFNPEPLPSDSPLWQTPNLIITPHSSSDDTERYTPRTLELVMRNMERFLAGKPLMNRVSPKLQY
jgi:glyoxylate/hydroxypyruvate reductase A